MEAMGDNLTTAQMLEVLRDEFLQTSLAKHRSGVGALEALKASATAANAVSDRIERLSGAIPQILVFLDEARAIQEDLENLSSDVEGKTWAEIVGVLEAGISAKLSSSDLRVRRAVFLAMVFHWCRQAKSGKAGTVLDLMLKWKFLIPGDKGSVRFQKNRRFKISDDFGLKPKDKESLVLRLKGLYEDTQVEEAKEAKPKEAPAPPALRAIVSREITPGQAWRGEVGNFRLHIPSVNGDPHEDLDLESQEGSQLFVAKASGRLRYLESTSIPLSAIKDDSGGVRDGLKLVPPPLEPRALQRWKNQKEGLGFALQRGFKAVLEGQKDMDPRVFLSTNAVGDAVLTFEGLFRWEPERDPEDWETFEDLTLRFARRDDGKLALIEVVSEEARERLEGEVGQWRTPGEAFLKMQPFFLRLFLRAVYGQVVQSRVYG